MAETQSRPPNPKCAHCNHPRSFHSAKDKKKRPCNAFGCLCENFAEGEG